MSLRKKLFLPILLFFVFSSALLAQTVSINNTLLRKDTDGNIIDAHDGRLIKFGDTFYLYGTAYGNTDGYGTANHFQCYKSPDLTA